MMMSTQATKAKKEAQKALSEMITDESPLADVSLSPFNMQHIYFPLVFTRNKTRIVYVDIK